LTLQEKISDGIEFERIQIDLANLFEGYRREKENLAETQKAVLNILDDFVAEKSKLENYQKALLNILDDYQDEKNKVEKTNEELLLSNKELESFSYSVSHDLRTPIRAINSFTTIIKRKYLVNLDDEGKELVNFVINESVRMGQLIDDLLSFARLGRKDLHKTSTNMTALAKEAVNKVLSLAEVNYKAKIKVNNLPPSYCDNSLMLQVFINLISNALKFSEPKNKPVIEIGYTAQTNLNYYYVKDNGVGFDMKFYDKLFGVFQRLHNMEDFKGTGIGLAIVQRIIIRHGGRVKAEGKINEGASFYFSLPE
jgi:light-regulated signal transduction histidine kinase (bacteriophytochrome)